MPEFVRDWRPGDPREAKGRSLWTDNLGDEAWLSPAEVKALDLTGVMRGALRVREAEPGAAPEQESRTGDVRPASEEEGSAVSADEYFKAPDREDLAASAPVPDGPPAGPLLSDPAYATAAPLPESEAAALRESGGERRAEPRPVPSGQVDGWRWWWVQDGDARWLAYDNRPSLEAWDAALNGDGGEVLAGRGGPRPTLSQGIAPVAVLHAAAAIRAADAAYPSKGGTTQRYVRECLLPELERRGLVTREPEPRKRGLLALLRHRGR